MAESLPTKERLAKLNAILDSQDIYGDWEGLRALSPYKIAVAFERLHDALDAISKHRLRGRKTQAALLAERALRRA